MKFKERKTRFIAKIKKFRFWKKSRKHIKNNLLLSSNSYLIKVMYSTKDKLKRILMIKLLAEDNLR
jgi:hypothetical protein